MNASWQRLRDDPQGGRTFEMIDPALPHCPSCGGVGVIDVGALPALRPRTFGGNDAEVLLEAGHLFHCLGCDLYFRHPYVSQSTLNGLYEKLPSTVWKATEPGPWWPEISGLMDRYSSNRRVLDVGCFRGDFLHWLPEHWQKMGIEPNAGAREVARARGIELIITTVERAQVNEAAAGVITLLDVLEHLVCPFAVLGHLREALADNGSIIILTGAADSLPWRIFGRDYWYASLPEHVSFFTLRWFRWAAERLGFSAPSVRYISSNPGSWKTSLPSFLRQSGYSVVRRLQRSRVPEPLIGRLPFLRRAARWSSPPWWREAKDHILIVLTKK